MKHFFLVFLFMTPLILSCGKDDDPSNTDFVVAPYDPIAVTKTNSMNVYVHYMPWFETPATSPDAKWGWHWTMNNKNPDVMTNGKRQIASWFYPSIGPYASSDPHVLEYHLLLMKYAGIDGVFVDWYGLTNINDLPQIKKNTDVLFKTIEKVGLKFAIVYEDQFLQGDNSAQRAQAQQDMKYIQSNYFNKDYYVKIDSKPLLMIFGPQKLQKQADWDQLFAVLTTKPTFLPLQDHSYLAGSNAQGEFMWVDAKNPVDKYTKKSNFANYFGCAYPGFKDYYKEGNAGASLPFTWDYNNGNLYKDLLNLSKTEKMNFLQLATWNDFGEGTMIEPTDEFGYTFLKSNQTFAGVSYSEKELGMISSLYNFRKSFASDKEKNKMLDQVFYYLISLQVDKADELLKQIASK